MATLGPPSDAARRPGAVASDHWLQTPACSWLNRAFWKDLRRLLGDTKESWVQARPLEPSRKCDGVGERGAQDSLSLPFVWTLVIALCLSALCSTAHGSQKTSSFWSSLVKKLSRLLDTRKGRTAWGDVLSVCLFPIPLCACTHPSHSSQLPYPPHPLHPCS